MAFFQARILEWVAISFSRESSWPRDQTPGILHCRQVLYHLSYQGSRQDTTVVFNSSKDWAETRMISRGWLIHLTTLYSVCFFISGRRFPVKMEINRFLCPFYFRGRRPKIFFFFFFYQVPNNNFQFSQLLTTELILKNPFRDPPSGLVFKTPELPLLGCGGHRTRGLSPQMPHAAKK